MLLLDVNILVYAFRGDAPGHAPMREWLMRALSSDEPVGLCDPVVSGFIRVTTHPAIFSPPTPVEEAFRFLHAVRARPNHVHVTPGERHLEIFQRLCVEAPAKGNLVPDAWNAALAMESGCTLVTTDADYSRFKGLRWRHPLRA
ncbi:MAG: type II toxin-antitoxin system VapC family toxin [Myxococcota bacterium]